jgi:NADPH2:quinone reductase
MRLGAALGARVLAVVAGDSKRELCARSGAEVVIDRTASSVPDAVLEATGGAGVDVVYDPVGGTFAGAMARCLAPGGRLLAVGFASGKWVDVDVADLVWRNASIVGVYAGGQTRAEAEADHERLLDFAADGSLGRATRVVSFDALPDALNAVDRAQAVGKLVVKISDADP